MVGCSTAACYEIPTGRRRNTALPLMRLWDCHTKTRMAHEAFTLKSISIIIISFKQGIYTYI
jgi:hypothetical protein